MSTPELSPDELTELLSGLTPEIPDCRVLRLIGRGGMSFVYLGVQESLERQVAIKVIAPRALKDEVSKARFEREARTIAKLQHPCIVGIYAVGRSEQGLLYYVLPYLAKGHLGQRDLTRDDGAVVEVVRALLWALDYAHAHGVVHRDVKAENVLFDNADRPLLADFGIAASKRDRTRVTNDGQAVGSGPYMAPEQARAELVDGRADLYSLGVLTFEMVSGQLPFRNPDELGLAVMHAVDPVPRLPAAKQHWQAFIDKAMAKLPRDRFQDAREMMAALERVVDQIRRASEPVRPAPVASLQRWFAERRPTLARIALASGALALMLSLGPTLLSRLDFGTPPAAIPTLSAPAPTPHLSPAIGTPPPQAPVAFAEAAPPVAAEAVELAPGEAELAAAQEQIARRRLTQPPHANAYDSLLAAQRIDPNSPQLPRLGRRWLEIAAPYVARALESGKDEDARTLFSRAANLADALELRNDDAWTALETAVLKHLSGRLRSALERRDLPALRAAKADVARWSLPTARFEPYWSQPIVSASPGDRLRRGGTTMVLARLPAPGRPGIAVLPHAVTRKDYAAFVAATGRASDRCRVRTATVSLRRRNWQQPGFAQQDDHPVVCVSAADAAAYAAWLGARDGQRYRLPSAGEWQALALGSAQATCGKRCSGTASVAAASVVAAGVRSHAGTSREWSADCSGSCARQVTLGTGWRDSAARSGARSVAVVEADSGYDDVGFRLLRDVAAAEVEQR
jgi:serine/threonine-protein kinase PpkA